MKKALIVMALFAGVMTVHAKPLIVAHRGASAYAPENTTPSIQMAWDLGSDGCEYDVYLTKDNEVMLLHDKTTSRTAPGTNLAIKKSNSEDLARIDVGAWKNPVYEGTMISKIEEAFEYHPMGKIHVIEVKDGPETIAPIARLIKASDHPASDFLVISFNLDTCIEARKQLPEVEVYFLKGAKNRETGKIENFGSDLIELAKKHNFTGLNLDYNGITKEFIEECKANDLRILTWTVDGDADVERLTRWGIQAITTNRPDTARRAMERALKAE